MESSVVLYRRAPDGSLIQYEFGGRSAYQHLVEPDGRRRMLKHYSITSVADAIRDIPVGTPVPASDVPEEPPLFDPDRVPTTPP